MKTTTYFRLLIITLIAYSCSSNDDSNNEPNQTNSFSINGTNYELENAYIIKTELNNNTIYAITLTKGEILTMGNGQNETTYSNDFSHSFSFGFQYNNGILSELPIGTYEYDANGVFNVTNIKDQYVIENNLAMSYNNVFNQSDIVANEGRIIIAKLSDGNYNFNFNFVTALGQINGSYTGSTTEFVLQ